MSKIKPKILIFEDDANAMDIYATKFSVSGFTVKVFKDYVDIPDIVIREGADIVSCDIVMPPPMDGHEAIRLLVTDRRTRDIPIIVLSNLDSKDDVDRAFGMGIIKYFVKANYTPSEVVKEVKDHLIYTGRFTERDFKPRYLLR
jgi:two-component system chemotaxis sensor kinase CheA